MDFQRVLRDLREFGSRHDVPFALIGGLALAAYGIARATEDVDIVIPRAAQDHLVGHLEATGFRTLHCSEGFSNHHHPDAAYGRVDVMYVDTETATKLFAQAQERLVLDEVEILVVSPEHLIVMKALAIKNDPDRRLQDLADVRALARLPGVDPHAVRAAFLRYDLLDELEILERNA